MREQIPGYPKCFCCGKDNPRGLQLDIFKNEDKNVEIDFTPDDTLMSWENIMHGGLLSSLLDEALVWAIFAKTGKFYVTAELNMRFVKPVELPVKLKITASADYDPKIDKKLSKRQTASGEIRDDKGTLYAKATGKFFKIPEELAEKYYPSMNN